MESKRQQKFAGLLQEELAAIFQREGSAYLPNTLVTITKVRVSPDLAVAKVYLSFLNTNNTSLSLATVNSHSGEIDINWVHVFVTKLGLFQRLHFLLMIPTNMWSTWIRFSIK